MRRRSHRKEPLFLEEESSSADTVPDDSGLFEDTPQPPTPKKDRLRTPKRKRSSPPPLRSTPISPPASPETPADETESGVSFGLFDETLLPPTQKEHRLKTPKRQRTPSTRFAAAAAAAGTRSVDRPAATGRRRSGKRPILPLKKKMQCGAGEVSLWDVAMAKNKQFAKWIEEREELDRRLDTAELSIALDQTFPDRMNTTI